VLALDLEWGLPILLILVIVLFGAAKIPQLARSLGTAQREFKKGRDDTDGSQESESKGDG
jgi:sec-independent protein translocase protein TatA